MKSYHSQNLNKKFLKLGLILFFLVLIIIRFVHLDADFPRNLNWSGDLYTDEGWYSANAQWFTLTGQWHIDGGANLAFFFPVIPIIQIISFKLFGISLITARSIVAIFSILTLLFLYILIKKFTDKKTALLSTAIAASNFFYFSFSRLAILEIPTAFFITAACVFAFTLPFLSGLMVLLAILTKTAAIFCLPVIVWLINFKEKKLKKTAIFLLISLGGVIIYYLLLYHFYPSLSSVYVTGTINTRFSKNLPSFFLSVIKTYQGLIIIDPFIYSLMLVTALITIINRNKLGILSIILFLCSFSAIGIFNYNPPRYYLIIFPWVILATAVFINYFWQTKIFKIALLVLLNVYFFQNILRITNYFLDLHYSFADFSSDIQKIIITDKPNQARLIGNISQSVGLATGFISYLDFYDTRQEISAIKKYNPNYYVSLGQANSGIAKIYNLELVKKYSVFNDYKGKQVYFYRVNIKGK